MLYLMLYEKQLDFINYLFGVKIKDVVRDLF